MSTLEARIETLTDPPDPDLVEEVTARLLEGGVVVLPTDTVYALCAAAESAGGLRRVFDLKGREGSRAIPVFVGDLSQARTIARFNAQAERLAAAYWPGALTLVLERRPGIEWDLGGDPRSIGIRRPDSHFLSQICHRAGPITATSANRSGEAEAGSVAEAAATFGPEVDLYVDGGPSARPVPSTVVRLTGPAEILRAGAIPPGDVLSLLK